MKCVLFSYIIHYPFLFAFRWGYRRISQRICQRHGKIARKHFTDKDRVRLDNEFGSFFISRHYFSLKDLWSLTYSTATKVKKNEKRRRLSSLLLHRLILFDKTKRLFGHIADRYAAITGKRTFKSVVYSVFPI